MPVGPFPTFDACLIAQRAKGESSEAARRICGALERDTNKNSIHEDEDEKRKRKRLAYRTVLEDGRAYTRGYSSSHYLGDFHELRIDLGEFRELPTSFRIFRAGDNPTKKGTFVFDHQAATAVMNAFKEHGQDRLPLDFNHGMFSAVATAENSKAAGWFVPVVTQAGELWATNVEWTPTTQRMLRDREFRFISPAFLADKDKRITRLLNVALTNTPATQGLVPLVASDSSAESAEENHNKENQMSAILQTLGVDSEAAALKIVHAWAHQDTQLLSITGTKTLNAALEAIQGYRVTVKEEGDKVVALTLKVAELEGEKEAAEEVKAEVAKAAFIKKLGDDGKAYPSIKKYLQGQTMEQLIDFEKCAAVFKGKEGATPTEQPKEGAVKLSEADVKMCTENGWDQAEYLKTLEIDAAKEAKD